MPARILHIDEKVKTDLGAVRPSDFKVSDGGPIDAHIVLDDPNVTLYCLDFENDQALFTQTPPSCDLTRVPFMYAAQYEQAARLIQVPFETLHALAADVTLDPARLILIYSVGRCGSTLLSVALGEVEAVESLSEPDVFTQMRGVWGNDGPYDLQQRDLLKACTLLQCVPGQRKGATAWALKFRSGVTHLWPIFHAAFPEARIVFLYRKLPSWARSFHRMVGGGDPTRKDTLDFLEHLFGVSPARLAARGRVSMLEIMADHWGSVMAEGIEIHRCGIPMFAVRYEELSAAPREAFRRLLGFCGLEGRRIGDLDAVLARDSQAGSSLSRETTGAITTSLSDDHLAELSRLVDTMDWEVRADTILPGTFFPPSA